MSYSTNAFISASTSDNLVIPLNFLRIASEHFASDMVETRLDRCTTLRQKKI